MKDSNLYVLAPGRAPDWLTYPGAFLALVDDGMVHLVPWHFIEGSDALRRRENLLQRFQRDFLPFAQDQQNDDVACFERGRGDRVFIVNTQGSREADVHAEHESFVAWLRSAANDFFDFYDDSPLNFG